MNRKERGITQKLFLINTNKKSNTQCLFNIMGLTGNIYLVDICNNPTCTCPDFKKRKLTCKHIYFVLLRVLKLSNINTFTDQELINILSNINIDNTICVDKQIMDKYNKLPTKKDDEESCPICLEDINNGEDIEFCKSVCGKCVHKLCFDLWCTKNPPKCVYCRADWNGYINLKN